MTNTPATARSSPSRPAPPERIGLFGGSFDPVHSGHLHVARAARDRFDLDRVVFVPARQSPYKPARRMESGEHRLAMLRLAVAGEPRFEVSDLELSRPGPSYTVDTWRALPAAIGAAPSPEIFLVLGSDNLRGLEDWRDARALLEGTQPVVVHRRDADGDALARALAKIELDLGPAIGAKLRNGYVELPPVDVSSTELRARLPEGVQQAGGELPPAVLAYIREHGLYGVRGP